MVYTCTTRDRGILWEKRDSQGLAGTGTRVTLAITQAGCGVKRTGTGTRDAFFLGEKGPPERRDRGILWENRARRWTWRKGCLA